MNIRLRVFKDYVDSKFVNSWFLVFSREYFSLIAPQTVEMASINQEQLRLMPIPLAPLQQQKETVVRIEELFLSADQIEKNAEHTLEKASKLDGSILTKAFRGELVPQDPNDEPASIMLERI